MRYTFADERPKEPSKKHVNEESETNIIKSRNY